jgi:hypothetical protein
MVATLPFWWRCGMLLLELWNKGTGGRCDWGCGNAMVDVGAELA